MHKIEWDPKARSYKQKKGKFWHWTEWNIAPLWKEFSDKLAGRRTNSRQMTRKMIAQALASFLQSWVINPRDFFAWIGIDAAKDHDEAKKIIGQMKQGKMPPSHPNQALWNKAAWQYKIHLHHKKPRNQWWPVHALYNLLFTAPRTHKELLDPKFHYGDFHWKKREEETAKRENKRREQIQLGNKATNERAKKRWILWQLFWPIEEEPDR